MSRSLFDISEDMLRLDGILDAAEGDMESPDVVAALADLERVDHEFESKVDGYCAYIGELTATANARKEESERLLVRARVDEARAKWLKRRLLEVWQEHGLPKMKTRRFNVVMAKNGGLLPLEVDEADVPDDYKVTPDPIVANGLIRKALDDGTPLAFARYGERGVHLRIR